MGVARLSFILRCRPSFQRIGKAPPTSTLGQYSVVRAFNELGTNATPHQLLEKSKRNKKEEWITPKAAAIDAEFQRLRAEHDPSGLMTDDEFRLYLEAAGGFDAKTRVFGCGSVARELFVPPTGARHRSTTAAGSYTPSIISQYASKNAELETRIIQLQTQVEEYRSLREIDRKKIESVEAVIAQQLGWTFNVDGTCNPDPTPGPRDHFLEDGHGFGANTIEPGH